MTLLLGSAELQEFALQANSEEVVWIPPHRQQVYNAEQVSAEASSEEHSRVEPALDADHQSERQSHFVRVAVSKPASDKQIPRIDLEL